MIVKIDADFIKNLKNFIANNPVTQVAFNDGSGYKNPCMLSIGNELLWKGSHNSSDWIIDKNASISSMGHKHKKCTECGKVLEEEVTYASDEYYEDYFTFYWKSDTAYSIEVKEGVTLVDEIYIPESYKGKPITHIENEAFKDCTFITKVTIPKSITHIGDGAFKYCSQLADVVFAENSQLTYIGQEAFYDCDSLTSVIIPNSVAYIGFYAFYSCSNLISVVIPDSVTTIDTGAFLGCLNLTYVYYNGTVKKWSDIEIGILNGSLTDANRYYYAKTRPSEEGNYWRYVDGKPVVWCYHEWSNWTLDEATRLEYRKCEACDIYTVRAGSGVEGDIIIPATYNGKPVTSIADYAFLFLPRITSVIIPIGITSIGVSAFDKCANLARVEIPDSVEFIGEYAFSGCSSLARMELPEGIESIPKCMFALCRKLEEVNIPASVTSIGDDAFSECTSIAEIILPEGVTSIGKYAFESCNSLTKLFIPAEVTKIGYGAFKYCPNLSIEVDENNKYYRMRDGCLWEIKTSTVIHGEVEEIPDDTIAIADGAFYGNTYFAPIKIPLSVTNIGSLAFGGKPVTVHVEAESKPAGWADDWCDDSVTVVWGYVEEDTDFYILTEDGERLTDEQDNALLIEGVDTSTFILTENGEFLTDEQGDILMIEGD